MESRKTFVVQCIDDGKWADVDFCDTYEEACQSAMNIKVKFFGPERRIVSRKRIVKQEFECEFILTPRNAPEAFDLTEAER